MTTKMMNFFIMTLLILSFLSMIFSNHPLMIAMATISQCLFMAMLISKSYLFSWFSFLIFIIYLGGILMLFSYIISITFSEEPMLYLSKFMKFYIIAFLIISLLFSSSIKQTSNSYIKISFTKLISSNYSSSHKLSMFLMVFLLIIMIYVVFMNESTKGNMRIY